MRRMLKAVSMLGAVGLMGAVVALAGKPQPPPTGPWDAVYGSQVGSKGDLTLMKADGSSQRIVYVTDPPHYPRLPDWSHDGRYVSFNVFAYEGRILQVDTLKNCLLYNPHGTSSQSMEFHPSFGEGVGDGHYLAVWTNWNNESYDIDLMEFTFQEGTCAVRWADNLTGTPDEQEFGAAWSPVGTAQETQLATLISTASYKAKLRIHDVVTGANGHLALSGSFVDYELDPSLYYPCGFSGMSGWSLQWSADPNVLGLVAGRSPDGGTTKFYDVYAIDIRTNPPLMTNLTHTEANETYFDFMPNGAGIVVGNDDGIWKFPTGGNPVCIAPADRRKWPKDPAWNPTR